MTIPQKGSRTIQVDGIQYHWYVRRKPTIIQSEYGGLSFAVELSSDQPTSTLVVVTTYDHPNSVWHDKATILPSDVAKAIQVAIGHGWKPQEQSGSFEIAMQVGTPIDEINNNEK